MISEHKMRMMMMNRPAFFLPVSAYKAGNEIHIASDKNGFAGLTGGMLLEEEMFLTVVYKCWFGVTEACSKYIFPEDYELAPERLFVSEGGREIKCEFVPVNDERRSREGVFEFGLRTICADAMCALTEKLNVLSDGSAEVLTKEVVKIFTAYRGDIRRTGREISKLRKSIWIMRGGELSRGLDL